MRKAHNRKYALGLHVEYWIDYIDIIMVIEICTGAEQHNCTRETTTIWNLNTVNKHTSNAQFDTIGSTLVRRML